MSKLNKSQLFLIETVNFFRGKFPEGYRSVEGISEDKFNECVKEMSEAKWLHPMGLAQDCASHNITADILSRSGTRIIGE